MTADQLKERIEALAPGTHVEVTDLTGNSDHFQAIVVSSFFEGKMMIEQHRTVLKLFEPEMASGELHALMLKTYAPNQYPKI